MDENSSQKSVGASSSDLEVLFESVQDLVWCIDTKYRLTKANARFKQTLGAVIGREITIGESVLFDNFAGPALHEWKTLYDRVLKGEPFHYETMTPEPNGTPHYLESSFTPIFDVGGSVVGATCFSRDVTHRKHAEDILREGERRLRTTLDSMLEGCQIIGQDWRYLYLNDSAARQGRQPKEVLLDRTMMEAYPGIENTDFFAVLRKCMNDRISARLENEFIFPDGGKGWFELSIQPVPEGIFILSVDITENRKSEENLRQSVEQFRLIAENVADLIALIDIDGKRLYNSPSYNSILGDPELLRGKDSFEEIHPEDRAKVKESFDETVRTGVGHRLEYRFLLKDGSIRQIESQGSAVRDKGGKVSKVVVVSRDVTEKKRVEQQYLRVQRMESIGTLAGGIAHDLNNILSPILLAINMLRREHDDKESTSMIDILESNAKRGADLVKQVLSFARGLEGERTLVQIRHVISEVEQIIRETFPKSFELSTNIPKGLWLISADSTQLHQIFMNLAVNSRDAMPNGGRYEIKAQNITLDRQYAKMHIDAKEGDYVLLSLTDQGSGIPPNILDRIFEPFFTTKEFGKGTGLGLSTVLSIVKSHGGFINVYSEMGKGTEFSVYLPADKSARSADAKPEEMKPPSGKGETILLIDDEAAIREITKTTLLAYGYEVITANDGIEALAIYASMTQDIDVVITDMMMPYLDGAATIRALQKMNPFVKILGVSGLATTEDEMTQGNQGDIRFLHKPYSAEKLLIALREVIEKR